MSANIPEKPVILIVEDDVINLRILTEFLDESNFEILVAKNGESAIRQAMFACPDIILLDIMMPGIDGFETCRRLQEEDKTKEIPIIFLTALSAISDKVRGFSLGAVDYITKPFKKEEIIARVTTHLTLKTQKKKLEELNATKDKFFSIIAHDMRNIFNGLIATSWLIAESSEKIQGKEMSMLGRKMYDSTKMAHTLLENLLNWARLQNGAIEFCPINIFIKEIIDRITAHTKTAAERKSIVFFTKADPEIEVYADPNMLDTILRNLVSNAIKFTNIGGEIHISAVKEQDFIKISVKDTGIGIAKQDVQKLLKIENKFKREGTEGEQGTGLGLLLCREFIEKNNGSISIESEIDQGTTFTFTLPAVL